MHEGTVNLSLFPQSIPRSRTPPGGGPSWAYSPYLPLESKARESRNETQAKQAFMHACVCTNQCYKKGRLVCTSSCHGCPTLHRRTRPLAPHDNHSLAEGHRFFPNLTSNHLQSFLSSPLLFVSAATRLFHGDRRPAMCMLHTRRAHLRFIRDSLDLFVDFGILGFLILSVSVGGICMFIYLCVSRHFPVYVRHIFIISLFLYFPALR